MTDTAEAGKVDHEVDVLVIGAGVSGIGAAYRLQKECPEHSYAILEARQAIGGTWDLFRYPGVRSDSDIFTFSYPFRPWQGNQSLADGDDIRHYIEQIATDTGIDRKIHFGTRVIAAAWSSTTERWTVITKTADPDGEAGIETWSCNFLYACVGYYDYDEGYLPDIPGLDSFSGPIIHPQSWPTDLDVSGRRVVVIGSGATAVTLVPALAKTAAHVTMLQRSPAWIILLPRIDPLVERLRRRLPLRWAYWIVRLRSIALSQQFYLLTRRHPERARRMLTAPVSHRMGAAYAAQHFTPRYDPWDQRLCVIPDGDLFKAIQHGAASMVTDRIERIVSEGIRLASGEVLPADMIITATGLRLRLLGGISLSVDGEQVVPADRAIYRGLMLSGVPNFAMALGYVNVSFTLRADLASRYVCRFLRYLRRHRLASGYPVHPEQLTARPLLPLSSGYIRRALPELPIQGSATPWYFPQNYFLDAVQMRFADLRRDMHFDPAPAVTRSRAAPVTA